MESLLEERNKIFNDDFKKIIVSLQEYSDEYLETHLENIQSVFSTLFTEFFSDLDFEVKNKISFQLFELLFAELVKCKNFVFDDFQEFNEQHIEKYFFDFLLLETTNKTIIDHALNNTKIVKTPIGEFIGLEDIFHLKNEVKEKLTPDNFFRIPLKCSCLNSPSEEEDKFVFEMLSLNIDMFKHSNEYFLHYLGRTMKDNFIGKGRCSLHFKTGSQSGKTIILNMIEKLDNFDYKIISSCLYDLPFVVSCLETKKLNIFEHISLSLLNDLEIMSFVDNDDLKFLKQRIIDAKNEGKKVLKKKTCEKLVKKFPELIDIL